MMENTKNGAKKSGFHGNRNGGHAPRPNKNLPLQKNKPASSAQGSSKVEQQSSNRPCREHSFLTDVAEVRQMEQGLLQLLDDFHSGKLQAFGRDCTYETMDQVREQQEGLARLHFEVDSQQEMRGYDSQNAENRESGNKNMGKLMNSLQELCTSIQNLQKGEQVHPTHP